jgi:hypothetical protein
MVMKRTMVEVPPKMHKAQKSHRHPSGPVIDRYPAMNGPEISKALASCST